MLGIVWGAALLTAGPSIWRPVDGRGPTEADRVALTFLGTRHVVTGASQLAFPSRFQRLQIGIDLVHAVTMVGLAAVDPPRRRPALVSAAAALLGAAAGAVMRR
ncbi:MAG TPA: hypothetical protein VFL38_11830 [Humibacillus xanthopallidus]|nr:hypothetical protein [Humibacillus xanthopallidus]